MKLVLFCHPSFSRSTSMPLFVRNLKTSYEARGHEVEIWSPQDRVYKVWSGTRFAKWAGYIDQYILFPSWVRRAVKQAAPNTLYVFCDQALGPWVPLVKDLPHVVHVHDFLALRSALGEIKENPTGITGKIYQRYIRHGFRQALHFISISQSTRDDLHKYGAVSPLTSECVYNCLQYSYHRLPEVEAVEALRRAGLPVTTKRMLLHISGGQWYKNLPGVVAIYAQYARLVNDPLPLWCVSPSTNPAVQRELAKVPQSGQVLFFSKLDNTTLQAAYSYASVFIFPSFAEGFGIPIIEALACGCSVITTDEPPMNEIGGDQARYIPRLRFGENIDSWAAQATSIVVELIAERVANPEGNTRRATEWASRFQVDKGIDAYLSIYERVLQLSASGNRIDHT